MRTEKELRIVLVLDEQRNFGRAASVLNMSQPALTRALQRIEQALEVQLFDRTKTNVAPTLHGLVALRHADGLMKGFEDLRRALKAARSPDQSDFVVSCGPLAAEAIGKLAFARYVKTCSHVRGQMFIRDWETCILDVREGRSHLAVTDLASARSMPDLEGLHLSREPGAFFCSSSHPLADVQNVGWRELVSFPWAFTAIQARFADMIPVALDKAGHVDAARGIFYPAIRVETFDEIKAVVRNCNAIGICSPHFLHEEIASGELALIDLFEPWMQVSYGLIWRKNAPPHGEIKTFLDVLVETQRERDSALPA